MYGIWFKDVNIQGVQKLLVTSKVVKNSLKYWFFLFPRLSFNSQYKRLTVTLLFSYFFLRIFKKKNVPKAQKFGTFKYSYRTSKYERYEKAFEKQNQETQSGWKKFLNIDVGTQLLAISPISGSSFLCKCVSGSTLQEWRNLRILLKCLVSKLMNTFPYVAIHAR